MYAYSVGDTRCNGWVAGMDGIVDVGESSVIPTNDKLYMPVCGCS